MDIASWCCSARKRTPEGQTEGHHEEVESRGSRPSGGAKARKRGLHPALSGAAVDRCASVTPKPPPPAITVTPEVIKAAAVVAVAQLCLKSTATDVFNGRADEFDRVPNVQNLAGGIRSVAVLAWSS